MSSEAFENALSFTLSWEGGYVNHPADRGGATNKGVTQKVYTEWLLRQGREDTDVRDLTDGDLHAIYEDNYWTPCGCPDLGAPLEQIQFDTAVNMGPKRAVRFLQQAVGADVDGAYGDGTRRCAAQCDPGDAAQKYLAARQAFYQAIVDRDPTQQVFMKGWTNRIRALGKHVGLVGFESAFDGVDLGGAAYMGRVPDIGEEGSYD